MDYTVAVFTCQPIEQRLFVSRHGSLVNKTPIAFIKVECFLAGDRLTRVTVPCDQSELVKVLDDEGVGGSFHWSTMHYVPWSGNERVDSYSKYDYAAIVCGVDEKSLGALQLMGVTRTHPAGRE